jgi:predicted porin
LKFGFYGQYENASIDEASAANLTDLDLKVWQVAASAQMGNTMAYFAWGQGEYDFNGIGGKSQNYDTWTLALIHSLSKRTKVYMGFSEVDCDARVFQAGAPAPAPPPETVGVDSSACGRVNSEATTPAGLLRNGEDDKFSIGMKHIF